MYLTANKSLSVFCLKFGVHKLKNPFFNYCLYISLLLTLLVPSGVYAQIVLNSGAKIVLNGGTAVNPVFVVLNTPPVNPVIANGTTDGIIMEAEYNRLQYNLGTGTTSITVPYMSNVLEQIPLTLVPTAAGTGAGNIRFSGTVAAARATGFDNVNCRKFTISNSNRNVKCS